MEALDTGKAVGRIETLLGTILQHSGLELRYTLGEHAGGTPALTVEFEGADVPHLLARHAELLLALEHMGAKAIGLEPEEHDWLSFDAGGFKAQRARSLERAAHEAIRQVKSSGEAFHFAPMNSRERRLLHLALTGSGLSTESEGEGGRRHLVVHPG